MNEYKARALFRAQFLGQEVLSHEGNNIPYLLTSDMLYFENARFLLLRSIDMLTDDEKILISSVVCTRHNRHYQPEDISYRVDKKRISNVYLLINGIARYTVQICFDGIAFVDYQYGGAGQVHYYCPGQYAATQLMLSLGIMLPFTYIDESGKPITLSVDEIIAKGWAKIKDKS